MMTRKHLHELLSEDQEPFVLKNYIADRRCLLKKPTPRSTQIQIRRRKPESSNLAGKFYRNACLFSSHLSPDVKMSPLVELQSPVKTPKTVFLHIPAHKAAILLDAAIRIHKQSSTPKPKAHTKNQGLGLFGSILKRFANRNRTQNCESGEEEDKVSVRDILKGDSPLRRRKSSTKSPIVRSEMGFSNGRTSSGFWSESNEEIYMDLETSCSSHFDDSEEFEFSPRLINNFCESPFRFVLRNSPSSASRTPEFSSPATSPSRRKEKENMNYDAESLNDSRVEEEEGEEDTEQCSPVSVLDPPFEDDEREDDGCDLDCSYAIVERARKKLLSKLSRFERLAELDPVELEKRMHELDEEDDDNDHNDNTDFEEEETGRGWFDEEDTGNLNTGISQQWSKDMKRLIADIVAEEERDESVHENSDEVVRRACKRLESWEEVKTNTIDMMVEQDLRKESGKRKMNEVEVRETAMDVELAIFAFLVEELATELDS